MEKSAYQRMFSLELTHWWFRAKRAYIDAVLKARKNCQIVDIGCGTGGTTAFFQRYGIVVGIEPSNIALPLLKKRGVPCLNARAERLPLRTNSVDLACLLDVLYHQGIRNDVEALGEAFRVLKRGGRLVVTDCAFEFLRSAHDRTVHARERYTKSRLSRRIREAGFTIQKASYLYWSLFPAVLVTRLLRKHARSSELKPVPPWLNSFLFLLCRIEARLLPWIAFPWGSSIIVVAEKG